MLYPVKIILPYQVEAGETTSFSLEDQVLTTARTIFNPVLVFINKGTGTSNLKINWVIDLGSGNDPLLSGTFTWTAVDDPVAAGNILVHDFDGLNLDLDEDVATRHSIYIENTSLVTQIYWVILEGRADIRMQLPASQEIIKGE